MKKILFPILIFLNATSLYAVVPSYVPSNGLVGWWNFSGNASDESGNGNHGTVNGATLALDRFGAANSAYSFNGSQTITGSCTTFPSGNSSRSISFWYNATNLGSSLSTQILGYGGNACGQSYIMIFENVDLPNRLGKYEIQGHCLNFRTATSYPLPANNTWHHIVLTYNGTNLKFYNDGVLVYTSPLVSINTYVTSKIFCFGKMSNENGTVPYTHPSYSGFNGRLDDIGIWNRELTACEVSVLYSGSNPVMLVNNFFPQDSVSSCNTNYTLNTPNGFNNYVWSTGATTQNILVGNSGWYTCTISNGNCQTIDNIYVNLLKTDILQNDTTICGVTTLTLNAVGNIYNTTICGLSGISPSVQSGLVGWWPFCGNANDVSGNGNNGIVNGGATLTTDRFGTANAAYSFNGSSQYISGNCSSFPSGNNSRSISFWYYATGIGAGTPCCMQILGYGGNSCGQSYTMMFENNDIGSNNIGKYEVQGHCLYFRNYTSYPLPANNTWHHIVLTYNGTNLKFYNDGILVYTSPSVSINTYVASKIFCFGTRTTVDGNSPFPGALFNGKLDDIGIWNRELTSTEVQQLYNPLPVQTYLWSTGATTPTINVNPTQTTKYYLTVSNGIASCVDSVIVNVCDISLNLKLFIEGYYNGVSNMAPVLLNQGFLPSNTICDIIVVELHSPTPPYSLIASTSAFLNTNGTTSTVSFNNVIAGSYYIVVKHRNALETWSSIPKSISSTTITYDFTTAANKAYGGNMKNMGGNKYAFYSGDFNFDENIDLLDVSNLETDINSFAFGYLATDLDGDGNVDLLDSPVLENNVNNFVFSIHP